MQAVLEMPHDSVAEDKPQLPKDWVEHDVDRVNLVIRDVISNLQQMLPEGARRDAHNAITACCSATY